MDRFSSSLMFVITTLSLVFSVARAQKHYAPKTSAQSEFLTTVDRASGGHIIVAGQSDDVPLLMNLDSTLSPQWKVKLDLGINNYEASIIDITVRNDTVFGAGYILGLNSSNSRGAFCFAINALDGSIFWSRKEDISKFTPSKVRYDNGRIYIFGAVRGSASTYDVKAICLNSSTGNLIWETDRVNLDLPDSGFTAFDDIHGVSEVHNGRFYMTGRSYTGTTTLGMRATLICFDTSGSLIYTKYLFHPIDGNVRRYYGRDVQVMDNDSLLITFYGDPTCSGPCNDFVSGIAFADLDGNIDRAYNYKSPSGVFNIQGAKKVGGKVYVANALAPNSQPESLHFMEVDLSGNILRSASYGIAGLRIPVFTSGKFYGSKNLFDANSALLPGFTISPPGSPQVSLFEWNFDNDLQQCPNFDSITVVKSMESDFTGIGNAQYGNHQINLLGNVSTIADTTEESECNINVQLEEELVGCDSTRFTLQGDLSDYEIIWSNGDTGPSSIYSNPGTHSVRVESKTFCCFQNQDFQVLPNNDDPVIVMDSVFKKCLEISDSLLIVGQTLNCTGCQYTWSNGINGENIYIDSSVNLKLVVSNHCGKKDSLDVSIEILRKIMIEPTDTNVCEGSFPITLNPLIQNADSISWFNGSNADSIIITQPGYYTVYSKNQCEQRVDTLGVFPVSLPTIIHLPDLDTCVSEDSPISFPLQGFHVDMWTVNGAPVSDTLTILNAGIYEVEATNSCGNDMMIFEVTAPEPIEYTFSKFNDTCLLKNETLLLEVLTTDKITWSHNGSNSSSVEVDQSGTYIFSLEGKCNIRMDSIDVFIHELQEEDLEPANVFTPNSDGVNDTWFPFEPCAGEGLCYVLNRWGQVVQTLNHDGQAWNGVDQVSNKPLSEGTYFYRIDYKNGRQLKGTLNIHR